MPRGAAATGDGADRQGREHDYLRSIGAADVLPRSAVQTGTRPLEKATWAGAVDPVGGDTLAWLLRTMAYRGAIAVSGLTGGTDVHTTVIPFILRGVKLLGIDSVMCPMDERLRVVAPAGDRHEARGARRGARDFDGRISRTRSRR